MLTFFFYSEISVGELIMSKFTLEGNEDLPAVFGGYLVILKDNQELAVVSVPSFNLLADRYRDSVIENDDSFEDDEGNEYMINIYSSNTGIDWNLEIGSQNEEILNHIKVEYQPNDY